METYRRIQGGMCDLLRRYGMLYSPAGVDALCRGSLLAKRSLNSLLGLTSDNGYRRDITLDDTASEAYLLGAFPRTARLLGCMRRYEFLEDFSFSQKRVKVPSGRVKLGKFLIRTIPKFVDYVPDDSAVCRQSILRTTLAAISEISAGMVGTRLLDDLPLESGYTSAYLIKELECCGGLKKMLPSFLEGMTVCHTFTLSTNPIDFITASSCCTFTSCYAMGSSYFAGTVANALDPYMFMLYSSKEWGHPDPGEVVTKTGRVWGFLYRIPRDDDSCALIIGFLKPYGILKWPLLFPMTRRIVDLVSPDYTIENIDMCSDELVDFSSDYVGYEDDILAIHIAVSPSELQPTDNILNTLISRYGPIMLGTERLCLVCGEPDYPIYDSGASSEFSLCRDCAEDNSCSRCGEVCGGLTEVANGLMLCCDCLEDEDMDSNVG